MIYEKNEEFETEITDISDEGSGIGRTDGFTWFIKDTVPGDKVRADSAVSQNGGIQRFYVSPACGFA